MDNENIVYKISQGRSIVCKFGVKGEGTKITRKDVGNNFDKLVEIGWIVAEKKDIKIPKEEIQEKIEPVVKEEIKIQEEKPKKTRKSVSSIGGAVKKDEVKTE